MSACPVRKGTTGHWDIRTSTRGAHDPAPGSSSAPASSSGAGGKRYRPRSTRTPPAASTHRRNVFSWNRLPFRLRTPGQDRRGSPPAPCAPRRTPPESDFWGLPDATSDRLRAGGKRSCALRTGGHEQRLLPSLHHDPKPALKRRQISSGSSPSGSARRLPLSGSPG